MQFNLFVLLTAILFLRPAEILPALGGLPLYQGVILLCLAFSSSKILQQISTQSLVVHPINFCMVGLLTAVIMSHLSHFRLSMAAESGYIFFRICLLYFLVVASINSSELIHKYLVSLNVLIAILAVVSLLHYHEVISIPGVESIHHREADSDSGGEASFDRLCGPGIFNDPNDLCLVLTLGILAGLYLKDRSASSMSSLFGLSTLPLLLYALVLTYSRGGLLTLLAGLFGYYSGRIGVKRAILLLIVVGALAMPFLSGRQTNIDLSGGTGHQRVSTWREGMALFWRAPLFGIGMDQYIEEMGIAAHNTFVHTYVELGCYGGVLFVAIFAFSLLSLYALCRDAKLCEDSQLRGASNLLLGAYLAFAAGFMSLSRFSFEPLYLVFGLTTAFIDIIRGRSDYQPPSVNSSTALRAVALGAVALICLYVFMRISP
jgi:hypothetical protein